jgi:hypothetical protein
LSADGDRVTDRSFARTSARRAANYKYDNVSQLAHLSLHRLQLRPIATAKRLRQRAATLSVRGDSGNDYLVRSPPSRGFGLNSYEFFAGKWRTLASQLPRIH